ncbi:BrnA antitoxin family protein [candidate division KSB1 bacterium]|nr:BrnA antitoxin family protein [candidate division KSB1 bacterium]
MPRNKRAVDPIPERFKDEKEAAAFWDTHSVADYWDEMQEAHFEMAFDKMPKAVALEYPVARKLSAVSRRENKSVDELVNLLLKEWLAKKPLSKVSPARSAKALKHA